LGAVNIRNHSYLIINPLVGRLQKGNDGGEELIRRITEGCQRIAKPPEAPIASKATERKPFQHLEAILARVSDGHLVS
jgi:hypothetical protein